MVEFKENQLKSLTRGAGSQLRKIKLILPGLVCEEGEYNCGNRIDLYTPRGFFKDYVGKISYDAKTPTKLTLHGERVVLTPIAEKLEKHGYQVTIYY
jgi:hypothetical protein